MIVYCTLIGLSWGQTVPASGQDKWDDEVPSFLLNLLTSLSPPHSFPVRVTGHV